MDKTETTNGPPNFQGIRETTRRWIESVVIGLNLCPFARRDLESGQTRFRVSTADDPATLLSALEAELHAMESAPQVTSALLIHPQALQDFRDYNDFLGDADHLLRRGGFEGVYQIASFHPAYQFAGTQPEDPENYSNRSPYPMLHILREAAVSAAVDTHPDIDSVPVHNVERLKRIGAQALQRLLADCQQP